jgi:hypothetical protein
VGRELALLRERLLRSGGGGVAAALILCGMEPTPLQAAQAAFEDFLAKTLDGLPLEQHSAYCVGIALRALLLQDTYAVRAATAQDDRAIPE